MKVLKPVDSIPASSGGRGSRKYASVLDSVLALPNGKMLPVECADEKEASSLCNSARWTHKLRVEKRGTTIYLSKLAPK